MHLDFNLERDDKPKPYQWNTWKNGHLVKSEPAKIEAFYRVYLNNNKKEWYSFEIRRDDARTIILDHDDTITEYLYHQKFGIKEVNAFVQRIFEAIYKDYFESNESN